MHWWQSIKIINFSSNFDFFIKRDNSISARKLIINPIQVKKGLSPDEADALKSKLEAAGAEVRKRKQKLSNLNEIHEMVIENKSFLFFVAPFCNTRKHNIYLQNARLSLQMQAYKKSNRIEQHQMFI